MKTIIWAIGTLTFASGCIDDSVGLDVGGDAVDGEVASDPDRPSDLVDVTCGAQVPIPADIASCVGRVANIASRGAAHVQTPTVLTYVDVPPSSGDHRPSWARWGSYDYLGPQRWLHNLEHGGIAFLYDPCADAGLITALGDYVNGLPEDDTGPFRWVLTPYPGLPTAIAAVAWEWSWQSGCLDSSGVADLEAFINAHYRQAPEDFAADGSYETGWIGR